VRGLIVLVATGLLLAVVRPAAAASDGTGMWFGPTPAPWVESDVTIDVRMGLAHGVVKQTFKNPGARAAEAVYVFPLPTGAAITAMRIEVGGEVVQATIAPRPTAQSAYEAAVVAGRAAALIERERPGVYTQSIAAVPGGGEVTVTLEWRARLDRSGGNWELAHPMVVGPRYVPGTATGAPTRGGGTSVDTKRAPDASRVTPPAQRDATTPFRFQLTLDEAQEVTSPTHELQIEAQTVRVSDNRGNRELIVRWRGGASTGVRAMAEPAAGGGAYVAVLIEPAAEIARARTTPRSWLVAIDRSASLDGAGAAQARLIAHSLIGELRDEDHVAVAAIGTTPRFVRATAAERGRAIAAVDRLGKGTADLTAGLGPTLASLPRSPAPTVVLITDGLVADDTAAIARAAAAGVVIHTVGVGAAPNRWLLEAIAARTGGTSHVVAGADEAQALAAALARAEAPLPVTVDWRKPTVTEAEPLRPLALAGAATLIVALDRKGVPDGEVEVAIGSRKLRAKIERVAGNALATEWARQRVGRLWAAGDHDGATRLAVERGIVSPTTALVAVGEPGGDAVRSTVTVPVPLPAGVRREALDRRLGDVDDVDALDPRPTVKLDERKPPPIKPADTGKEKTGKKAPRPTRAGGSGSKPAADRPQTGAEPPPDVADRDGTGDAAGAIDPGSHTVVTETDSTQTGEDRVGAAPPPPPSAPPSGGGASDEESYDDDSGEMLYTSGALAEQSVIGRHIGRRYATVGAHVGARIDDPSVGGLLSLGLHQRVTSRLALGLAFDLGLAPAAEEPVVGNLMLDVTRSAARVLELHLGAGLSWSGDLGFGYRLGVGRSFGGISIGFRLSGALTPEQAPVTLGVGSEASF
jgi:Ca-activated chloride channel family protein